MRATRLSKLWLKALRTDSNTIAEVPLTTQGVLGQTADLFQALSSTGAVKFKIDVSGNTVFSGATTVVNSVVRVPLTAAQIIAMYTTPVAIVAAPAAGTAIVVKQIQVELNPTATAFASGGVVHFYYHGSTTELMSATLAAATVQAASTQSIWLLNPVATSGGSVVTKEVGVDITNATGVFATGTGTAVVTCWYSTITLG